MIAYFSMEIGLCDELPTYSGGLGMLAGDTIKSAADCGLPLVAVTLLHRKGYFKQNISNLAQTESYELWDYQKKLTFCNQEIIINIYDQPVTLKAWKYEVKGVSGHVIPVYFIDASSEKNADQTLTDHLYGGDNNYRLKQEIILGIGGVRLLKKLGYKIKKYHMNEGHSAFLTLELVAEEQKKSSKNKVDLETINKVKNQCCFTTHTPVPAGHDRFSLGNVRKALSEHMTCLDFDADASKVGLKLLDQGSVAFNDEASFNMTQLALNFSSFINGVAEKHAEVSRKMFSEYNISHITNGIHVNTWVSSHLKSLFNKYIPAWNEENFKLRNANLIPATEILEAHKKSKSDLLTYIRLNLKADLDENIFTIGFARRFATYKRADLLFTDIDQLKNLTKKHGKLQIVFSGKAHPKDQGGKELISKVLSAQDKLGSEIKLVFIPNYSMQIGALITAGVDLWLNNPIKPMEASGTSGMKAALNAVPNLSILDGWWIEGCVESVTGWAIGDLKEISDADQARKEDASNLYLKLEQIIPMYYQDKTSYAKIMQNNIVINAPYFSTERMILEYAAKAYL